MIEATIMFYKQQKNIHRQNYQENCSYSKRNLFMIDSYYVKKIYKI